MKQEDVPVLVLGFNRPTLVIDLFKSLARVQPKKIYFAVDGPRYENQTDRELVKKVQDSLSVIDWKCEVYTLFRERNLGLKKAVIDAIDWIFENEEVAIILEDDCLPIEEFFQFCAEVLEKYRHNSKVMQISGNSFVPVSDLNCDRYYFSTLNDIWGWATWKRSWELFEREVPDHNSPELRKKLNEYFPKKEIARWFTRYIAEAKASDSQVWSTQWTLTLINNHGYSLVPQTNLVRNVGFSGDATHMTDEAFQIYDEFKPRGILSQISPTDISVNRELDIQRFSIIKATDLNLRKESLFVNALRKAALNILPKAAANFVRTVKGKYFV